MELLKERIRKEGLVLENRILKVDSFLNQQIDPVLMTELGEEFARRFANEGVQRIFTIEASGIAIALPTALCMGVPLVFARKVRSTTMNDQVYSTQVHSYTRNLTSDVIVSKRFLPPGERVLIIDDFLANGEAALGLAELVRQAGSKVVGIGIAIEKSFQPGAAKIKNAGYRLESLARIADFKSGQVRFVGEEPSPDVSI